MAGAEHAFGLAVDIDYFEHVIKLANNESSDFDGVIASIFEAGGLKWGVNAGGSLSFSVGYHVNNPDSVDGVGLDVGFSGVTEYGGGLGFGFDLSDTQLPIVTGSINLSVGAEVEASIGPSFSVVLGQLCSTGVFKGGSNTCPQASEVDIPTSFADEEAESYIMPELLPAII